MTVSRQFSCKMGVTMPLFWITLAISVLGSNAAGEFSVLYSPKSLRFSESSKIKENLLDEIFSQSSIIEENLLKEIFSASLGFSVAEDSNWAGLSIIDPFDTPEAIVEVYIDGISTLGEASGLKSQKYPLSVEYEPDTYDAVEHRIKQRSVNGGNQLVNLRLQDPDVVTEASKIFGELKVDKPKQTPYIKPDNFDEDFQFLYELAILNEITGRVREGAVAADNIVDFFFFRFGSLHALSDFHGPESVQTKEAKMLLGKALKSLSDAFVKAYTGSVLVTVVTTDIEHTRRARAAPELRTEDEDNYSADYAAVFNILLWFSVAFVFSLIAIVYAIMDMDPGRDSIIYRMTSTRMKKDN